MSEDTKNITNHEKRYNKEILDYVNYITPKEEMIINIEKTINILKNLLKITILNGKYVHLDHINKMFLQYFLI